MGIQDIPTVHTKEHAAALADYEERSRLYVEQFLKERRENGSWERNMNREREEISVWGTE